MKFYSDINLNLNQLKNAVIDIVASDGVILAPVEGQIIYAADVSLLKYYDGDKWVAVNDLEINIVGDSGSATLLRDETLTFVGGVNLTSEVDASDRVVFNLDPSIVLASDITVPNLFADNITSSDITTVTLTASDVTTSILNADTIYATDGYFNTIEVATLDAETVNSETINTTDANISTAVIGTVDAVVVNAEEIYASDADIGSLQVTDVNATNVYSATIVASDITTEEIYASTGSIGTAVFSSDLLTVTSSVIIGSDLVVNGSIIGDISTSDIAGVIFSVVASDAPFEIGAFDTLTFEGTENEIEVSTPVDGTVKIGIVTNPTLGGNVTITGDLTVQGSTTTVESQTLTVKDPLIELNTGIGDTNPHDLGIIMMRGASDVGENVGFIWDETVDRFKVIFTPNDASDSVITSYGYAPMAIGDTLIASDITTIGGKIKEYEGSAPNTGEILIGSADGFTRGLITGASDTGIVVTSSTDSIVVSLDLDGATDGTAITVSSTDLLILSDAGTEKKITVGQLDSVFVRHDDVQTISASDQVTARTNISAAEVVTATITTGDGTTKTFYIEHGIGSVDVLVQIFDGNGLQVFADIDTTVGTGGNLGNFISVTGNLTSETYTVRIVGTRGTPITGTTSEVAPS
jgi:hypothetical protein